MELPLAQRRILKREADPLIPSPRCDSFVPGAVVGFLSPLSQPNSIPPHKGHAEFVLPYAEEIILPDLMNLEAGGDLYTPE